jgi:hypothetical protein
VTAGETSEKKLEKCSSKTENGYRSGSIILYRPEQKVLNSEYPVTSLRTLLVLSPAVLRIRDVYPGFRIPDLGSRISDPGSQIPNLGSRIQKQQQKRGVNKISFYTFFWSHKFHKIGNYFIWANFQRIIELFTQNIVTKLSKI